MTELVKTGYDISDLRCWAHSHADMDCFWSSEDADTIEQMCNDDWLVSIVTNRQGNFRARLDLYHPWRITIDQIKVGFMASVERDEELEKELRDKVHAVYDGFIMFPNRRALADFEMDMFEETYLFDDINSDLQHIGLAKQQVERLLEALEDWDGDHVETFWTLLDGVLDGSDNAVDSARVLQVLTEYGWYTPNSEGGLS